MSPREIIKRQIRDAYARGWAAGRDAAGKDNVRAALEEYHLHMGKCLECDKIVCDEGDELWFAVGRAAELPPPESAP